MAGIQVDVEDKMGRRNENHVAHEILESGVLLAGELRADAGLQHVQDAFGRHPDASYRKT